MTSLISAARGSFAAGEMVRLVCGWEEVGGWINTADTVATAWNTNVMPRSRPRPNQPPRYRLCFLQRGLPPACSCIRASWPTPLPSLCISPSDVAPCVRHVLEYCQLASDRSFACATARNPWTRYSTAHTAIAWRISVDIVSRISS